MNGVPMIRRHCESAHALERHQDRLIADIDADSASMRASTFRKIWFEQLLVAHGIPWERLESGKPMPGRRHVWREMARAYPIISPLRELRHALSDLRLNDLSVGDDGRNRTPLWAFGSKTGRNQPSNSKYIFGPSVWLRGLIKPPPGHAVAISTGLRRKSESPRRCPATRP